MIAPDKLSSFLDRLQSAGIHHSLRNTRDNATSVDVAVPGQRWEIDFLDDGSVEIEVFRSDGTVHDESKLGDLFRDFSD